MARKEKSDTPGRMKQIRLAYQMTKRVDSRVGLVVLGVGVITFAVVLAIGFLIGYPIYAGLLGVLVAVLAMTIVFGRRAERAAFSQMEGQPGAAVAVLQTRAMERQWSVTPTVAANRNQDVVHRAVGRAGIVLVGEGNPNRLRSMITAEKRKMGRVVADVPVYDVLVGDDEGQVPLKKLQSHLLRLPRSLPKQQVNEVNDRLRALGDLLSNMPVPKGPMPKNMRMPRGGRIR
ncbi:DUF4191 domain-containing protein [Allostreptomyces psammosilenae]|uniref:DUF4191 domain-containing protein n=1 Tax=Allostreptomyces psammosilenae TaxID=1892865 RepID=A0A852ZX65_9ACTN|nr:DUF4191 domain-containing protein [Allostreptomyces psammosilenae]NYI06983.1 hypothetical protein [Allostreptomyces psammosilenae]